jgi:hypothetical protein
MDPQETKTGINIELGHFPGTFFLSFCCPRVEIGDDTYQKPWGTHFIPLSAGTHDIKVFFKYMGNPRCGENKIQVEIPEGEIKKLKFFMPPLMTASGKLTEEG